MSTSVSTGLPRNSGLPLTQNTAPVLDFRCLYTHDLRQKKKRWHDGVLRFHTFNSRIMVYDISRNFIGDKYWREPEVVQDGDELELEKGVLIQVEEATGRTEQDLAPILNHHKTAQSDRPAVNPVRVHTASTAVSAATSTAISRDNATLLKPKSLNALLGTPKGKYGRAVLPGKSPFQSRHEATSLPRSTENVSEQIEEQIERPAKRLKTARDVVNSSENHKTRQATPKTSNTPRPQETKTTQKGQQAPNDLNKRENPATTPSSVIGLDTDEEGTEAPMAQPAPTKPKPTLNAMPTKTNRVTEEACALTSRKKKQPLAKSQRKDQSETNQKPQKVATPPQNVPLQDANVSSEDTSLTATRERSPPPYTLRFAATKPRKKLMYRDLLPDQPPSTSKISAQDVPRSRQKPTSSNSLSMFEQAQKQRLEDRMRKQRSPPHRSDVQDDWSDRIHVTISKEPQHPTIENSDEIASPNIPSEEREKQGSANCYLQNLQGAVNLDKDGSDKNGDVETYGCTTLSLITEAAEAPTNATKPASTNIPKPLPHSNHADPSIDQQMKPGDTILLNSIPAQERATSSTVHQLPALSNDTIPIPNRASYIAKRSPIRKSHSEINTASTTSTTTRLSTLKKQTSDVSSDRNPRSALNTVRDRALGATTAVRPFMIREDDVTGPWSREAFDLFGWRPGDSKSNIGPKGALRTGV